VKQKIPYAHPIDTFHKNPDTFGNGDADPFNWPPLGYLWPTWLKGRPEKLIDPRPIRTRYYYKYIRPIDGHLRWLATWEDAITQEDGALLIMKSIGVNSVECITKQEYVRLKASLKRMEITDYEV
jgi:hypothetical protein